uniref:Uncharacterized protein n=1 Tax=Anguilla anguilla TaxID=7936 RepID=A0A0E9S0G1_ANGAN
MFGEASRAGLKFFPPSLTHAAVLPDVSSQQASETDKSICNR